MQSYAVLWSRDEEIQTGRLDRFADRLELRGRDRTDSISLSEIVGAAISRLSQERLRGLPVLVLTEDGGSTTRIASLEGAGVLRELLQGIELD